MLFDVRKVVAMVQSEDENRDKFESSNKDKGDAYKLSNFTPAIEYFNAHQHLLGIQFK